MRIATTRVETFSDGVIAIVITIMVLELGLEHVTGDSTTREVLASLKQMLPNVVAYALSFLMIGIFWINHHHMFHLLEKTDEPLLFQNLFFLFWVSLIPFATSTLGSNPDLPTSSALYGLVMLMTTFAFTVMRTYTIRKKLLHRDEDTTMTRQVFFVSVKARTKSIVGTLAYLLAIPLAYVNVYFAYVCFAIPPLIFLVPQGIDDEKLAEKVDEKNG